MMKSKWRRRTERGILPLTLVPLAWGLVVFSCQGESSVANADSTRLDAGQLHSLLVEQRDRAGLVGLATMVMQHGEVVVGAADGVRRLDREELLSTGDRWHIGSITKSFTATLIARMVERGELDWDTRVGAVFRDIDGLDPAWNEASLLQLLSHTAGAPDNFSLWVRLKKPAPGKDRMRAREAAVHGILKQAPEASPGSVFVYSNVGYTIAGVIAEKTSGLAWEDLVRREVFATLELSNGGFGPPKDGDGGQNQPRGHSKNMIGVISVAADDEDNTPIMGPAGTLHMTLRDMLSYGNEHLRGETGKGRLLGIESYRRLHRPVLNNYALGWAVADSQEWARGPVIWHNGSNTMWYALLVLLPGLDAVIAVTSNDGNIEKAELAAWKIVKKAASILTPS